MNIGTKANSDVAEAADHGAALRGLGVLGGHDALEHVLLRDGAQHHGQAAPMNMAICVKLGSGRKRPGPSGRPGQHLVRAAGQVGREHRDDAGRRPARSSG
jgi:hypothetical protein